MFMYILLSSLLTICIPYHWGNPWFSTKIQFLNKRNNPKFDTYFFGSSLVYRQIDPTIFDTKIDFKTKSFNLGSPATFNPQNIYLYQNFLDSDLSSDVKYCFLELGEVDLLSDYFLHQERITYWQNIRDLLFVFKSINYNQDLTIRQKLHSYRNYLISYIENKLHLGHFGQQIINKDFYDPRYIGINGYFPLEMDFETTKDLKVKKSLNARRERIINNPELLISKRNTIHKYYEGVYHNYDHVYLMRIMALIDKSKEKGIHLVFIISPWSVNQRLLALSSKIPNENIIDMANPNKFKSIYKTDYSFDITHLNTAGSEEYSKLLAFEFKNIIDHINK